MIPNDVHRSGGGCLCRGFVVHAPWCLNRTRQRLTVTEACSRVGGRCAPPRSDTSVAILWPMGVEESVVRPADRTIRRGSVARGWSLAPRFVFADSSVVAGATPGTVWINVGTEAGDGIVNFRSPRSGVRGSCECLIRSQSEVFSHVFGKSRPSVEDGGQPAFVVTIVLPREWKPDDAAAAWLLIQLLRHGQLPRHARELAAYMALSRQSSLTVCPRGAEGDLAALPGPEFLQRVLASREGGDVGVAIPLYTAMLCRNLAMLLDEDDAVADSDRLLARLLAATELVDSACSALDRRRKGPGLHQLKSRDFDMVLAPAWSTEGEHPVFPDVRRIFLRLRELPRHALERFKAFLPVGESMQHSAEIECTVVTYTDEAESTDPDRKKRARVDAGILQMAFTAGLIEASDAGTPSPLIILHGCRSSGVSKYDVFLGLTSRQGSEGESASLRRLGLALEEREQQARSSGGIDRDPRRSLRGRFEDIPGIDDPWYDGRDHDFSIAGSPYIGSRLSVEAVRQTLQSAFWKPRLLGARSWSIEVDPAPAPDSEPAAARSPGVYRLRTCVPLPDGTARWAYADLGGRSTLRPLGFRVSPMAAFGECRADSSLLGLPAGHGREGEFRVLVLRLAPPPFAKNASLAEVADCVPEQVRDEFRRTVCGPAPRSIELDDDRIADVGTGGVVIWCRPGAQERSAEGDLELVLACMDVLAYRDALNDLMETSSRSQVPEGAWLPLYLARRWWRGESAGRYLLDFVDIVKSFRPESADADRRRVCELLEDVLSVHTTLARLERFLQFSDERERILRDGLLEFMVLLLAVPVLFQTPADLLQAWGTWQDKVAKPGGGLGVLDFWSSQGPAGWVLKQAALIASAVIAGVALLLAIRKVAAWLRTRGRTQRSVHSSDER